VFVIDGDAECLAIAERHGALAVCCTPLRGYSASLKAVLYSTARVIPAERFVCIDADTVILGRLDPLFEALDACVPGSILACLDQNHETYSCLQHALEELYQGSSADLDRLLDPPLGEADYSMIVNDGCFATDRAGLLGLDSLLRSMPDVADWVDVYTLRNQWLFNLALARMGNGVRMNDTYNVQLHAHDVEFREDGLGASWRGRPARVLHFNAWSRRKYPEWRQLVREALSP